MGFPVKKRLPPPACDLVFPKRIPRWDEAIALGNGQCGALIWGTSRALRFSLDRGDIWDNTPCAAVQSKEFTYQSMVRFARAGNEDEIRRIFDAPYNHILPSKLPAGKLVLNLGCDCNLVSHLSLACAQARVQCGKMSVRSFLHAEEKFGMIEIDSPPQSFSFALENPAYCFNAEQPQPDSPVDSVNTASLKLLHYNPPEIKENGDVRWFVQQIGGGFSYGIFVRMRARSKSTQLAYVVAASSDGAHWRARALRKLDSALARGYDACFKTHRMWWARYWAKSSVTLPEPLFEQQWYLTQYLLGSCSRKGCYPMPLQGVWTADNGALPPWKGDFHNDLNTQMSYYCYLKANHMAEGESFLDYLWSLADCAREFSKSFYGVSPGLCLPGTMSLHGAPLGGWGMYSLSPTNQIWLCQAFERHWRFSDDTRFLREKAYPYTKETGEFFLALLEERDGRYYLPVSTSPELHDDGILAFVTPNSNYDLALLHYLFTALTQMAQALQNGEAARWQTALAKLPQLAVTDANVLKISPDETLEESHRHHAHCMAIHPLRLLSYNTPHDRDIIDATLLDLERLGTGYWVGFSFTWMAELYAIAQNGNAAAYQLRVFWQNYCSPNGFHLNGDYKRRGTSTFHYRPFTLEANMCAADALQEMLLHSEDGVITLFPAIPEEWSGKATSFENLRIQGNILVSAIILQNKVLRLALTSDAPKTVRIRRTAAVRAIAAHGAWPHEGCCWLVQTGAVYQVAPFV